MNPLLIAAAAALGGNLIDSYNQRKVLSKQNRIIEQGIQDTRRKQEQGARAGLARAESLNASTPGKAREGSLRSYMQALRTAQPTDIDAGVSDDYDALAGGAEQDVANYGLGTANTLAQIDAPGLQRESEANDTLNLASQFDRLRDQIQGQQYIRQLRVANVRPNPWLQLASSALKGGSMAAAAGGFGSPSPGSADAFNANFRPDSFRVP